MVLSALAATNNGLAQDNDKRRKQTVERAKASHLSRQLQMRLQYARLKVDYGWQKQNLNEVENLYFHHSHQRGSKPNSPSNLMVTPSAQEPSTPHSSMTVATPPQSSLAPKLNQSFLLHAQTNLCHKNESPWQGSDSPSPSPDTLPLLTPHRTALPRKSDPSNEKMEVPDGKIEGLASDSARRVSSSMTGSSEAVDDTTAGLSAASGRDLTQPSPSLPSPWNITPQPTLPSLNHYPNVLLRQPIIQKQSSSSLGIGESSFGLPNASLTYDSFWSSHSSSTGSGSFRSSPSNATICSPKTNAINVGGFERT